MRRKYHSAFWAGQNQINEEASSAQLILKIFCLWKLLRATMHLFYSLVPMINVGLMCQTSSPRTHFLLCFCSLPNEVISQQIVFQCRWSMCIAAHLPSRWQIHAPRGVALFNVHVWTMYWTNSSNLLIIVYLILCAETAHYFYSHSLPSVSSRHCSIFIIFPLIACVRYFLHNEWTEHRTV